jgi:hypothetical protein
MTLTNTQPVARLIMSAAIIFGVLAAVAAASNALLQTNNATATGNDFSVASADILEIAADVNNGPGPYATTLLDAFNAAGMVPGDTREFKFWLRNTTNDDIELHLFGDLANYVFTHDATSISSTATELDANMKIKFLCDVINSTNDGNTPEQTLTAWTSSAATGKQQFDDEGTVVLGATPSNTNQAQCTMRVTLDSDSEDEGDSVQFDAIFSGEQVPS